MASGITALPLCIYNGAVACASALHTSLAEDWCLAVFRWAIGLGKVEQG
jgi:hypothetical protein